MENQINLNKKRIEYIDLMKGICIILVVLLHCNIQIPNEQIDIMLKNVRMPLYFFLSGMFFKEYSSFFDFVVRKTNKLIIPYIFFCFFPYTIILLIWKDMAPEALFLPIRILYVPMNFPLWFLRGLFLTYILYYGLSHISKSWPEILKFLTISIVTLAGWILNRYLIQLRSSSHILDVVLSMNIMVPFIALPYFYVASLLKKRNILTIDIRPLYVLIGILIFTTIWYFSAQSGIDYMDSKFSDNFILMYLAALSGIGVIWLISYTFKRIPIISYLGRYSIIILGTHIFFVILFIKILNNNLLAFILTIGIMPGVIWIFKKVFPYFTAQKDLFYLDADGKLRWGFNIVRNKK